MLMVTKRELWYRKKFERIFGGVTVHKVGNYFVFEKSRLYANKAKADQRKHEKTVVAANRESRFKRRR